MTREYDKPMGVLYNRICDYITEENIPDYSDIYDDDCEDIYYPFRMVNLLEEATHKFKTSNEDIKLSGSISELILQCYIKYDPSKRGNTLQKLIIQHLSGSVTKAPSYMDKGDFYIDIRTLGDTNIDLVNSILLSDSFTKFFKGSRTFSGLKKSFINRVYEVYSKFFEIKTSYLNKDGFYTVGNIRTYQNYDYLLILLVDCEDSFNYKILLIPKTDFCYIKMSHMHGTKKSNDNTQNPHLSFSIKKGSEFERSLDKYVVKNDFNGIQNFCDDYCKKIYENVKILTDDEYDYIVNASVKKLFEKMGMGHIIGNSDITKKEFFYENN